ncbi:MAG: hypothetical protein IJ609_04030 [Paludibacteraceae bacterium]|nr:hypothetical protein [Paludibacteraceae bacterium]
MTDKELDILFEQSAQNRQMVEQINRQVMRTVRRDMRLKALRKWAKLLALCFGLPLMIIAYLWLLKEGVPLLPQENMWIAFIVPVLTLLGFSGKFLHDFSVTDL